VKLIDGSLVMRHEYLAGAPVELMQIRQTASSADGVLHHPPEPVDVIVTTHKTIDLVFHTQVYKLQRDMTRNNAVSVSAITFMQNEVMEVNDETVVHSPATDGGRPAPGGASPQGAHDHSGTPGGQEWKSHSMRASRPISSNTKGPSRVNGTLSKSTCNTTDGPCCPSMHRSMMVSAVPGSIALPSTGCVMPPGVGSSMPW
jgi:hypothetical protein